MRRNGQDLCNSGLAELSAPSQVILGNIQLVFWSEEMSESILEQLYIPLIISLLPEISNISLYYILTMLVTEVNI